MSYGGYGGYGSPPPPPPSHGAGGYPPPSGYGGPPPPGGGYAGGFNASRSPMMPPGADPQLWNWFTTVDTDRSGQISAKELERALINGDWTPFDLDTVKLLMTIFDTDRSGTVGFNEFAGLWKYVQDWQGVFRHFDRDRSGTIDGREMQDALNQFGFNLSPQLLHLLEMKYDVQGGANAGRGMPGMPGSSPGISFDRFVRSCVVVKQLNEAFQNLDTDRDGWVQVNYDQFMHTVLSLP